MPLQSFCLCLAAGEHADDVLRKKALTLVCFLHHCNKIPKAGERSEGMKFVVYSYGCEKSNQQGGALARVYLIVVGGSDGDAFKEIDHITRQAARG